jgi:hypothetical protein
VESEGWANYNGGDTYGHGYGFSPAIRFAGKILGGLGINIIALTGPAPDLDVWKQALLECFKEGATCWAHVFPNSS